METLMQAAGSATPRMPNYDYGMLRSIQPNHRKPPYAKRLDPASRQSIFILTGTGAWDRADSDTWFPGCKLVLPFGVDPFRYFWPVASRDCVIFEFGHGEGHSRLVALSVALIACGATYVRWSCGPCPSPLFRALGTPCVSR